MAIPQHGQRRFSSNSLGNLYAEAIKAYETAWLHVADAPDGCSANNSSVGGIKLYGRVDRDRSVRHHSGLKLNLKLAGAEPVRRGARLGDRLGAAGVTAVAILEGEILSLVAGVDLAGEIAVRDVPVAVLACLVGGARFVEKAEFVDVDLRGGAAGGVTAVLVGNQATASANRDWAAGECRVVVDLDRLACIAPVQGKIRRVALCYVQDSLCLRPEGNVRVGSVGVELEVTVGLGIELCVYNGEIGPADAAGGTACRSNLESPDITAEIGLIRGGGGSSGSDDRESGSGEASRRVHFVRGEYSGGEN